MKKIKFYKRDLPPTMKFCKHCRFYVGEIPWERMEKCRIIRTVKWDYKRSWYEWNTKPTEANAKNNCTGYRKDWWRKK